MFDLDTAALEARGYDRARRRQCLATQNLITPVGIGRRSGIRIQPSNLKQRAVEIQETWRLPIKKLGAQCVHARCSRTCTTATRCRPISSTSTATDRALERVQERTTSTLDIVSGIKKMLQVIKPSLPDALDIKPIARSVRIRCGPRITA